MHDCMYMYVSRSLAPPSRLLAHAHACHCPLARETRSRCFFPHILGLFQPCLLVHVWPCARVHARVQARLSPFRASRTTYARALSDFLPGELARWHARKPPQAHTRAHVSPSAHLSPSLPPPHPPSVSLLLSLSLSLAGIRRLRPFKWGSNKPRGKASGYADAIK